MKKILVLVSAVAFSSLAGTIFAVGKAASTLDEGATSSEGPALRGVAGTAPPKELRESSDKTLIQQSQDNE